MWHQDERNALRRKFIRQNAAVARRKLKMPWHDVRDALSSVRTLCEAPAALSVETHEAALEIAEQYGYHIYDALLLAAALDACASMNDRLTLLPHVLDVHGRGLMLACEVDVSAPQTVLRALLEQRLVVNATGPTTIRLLPPLNISPDEIGDALARLGNALAG